MTRFLGPFRPVLDPVFECFSFFFTQKNGRFLPFLLFFAIFFAITLPYSAITLPYRAIRKGSGARNDQE